MGDGVGGSEVGVTAIGLGGVGDAEGVSSRSDPFCWSSSSFSAAILAAFCLSLKAFCFFLLRSLWWARISSAVMRSDRRRVGIGSERGRGRRGRKRHES